MLNDLYSDRLLAAAASLPPARRLEKPDGSATRISRVCGSTVTLDLAFDGAGVVDAAVTAKACAIGQAATGLFMQHCIGATTDELCALHKTMQAFLRDKGPAPTGRFEALNVLAPIADYPQRHSSALLIFDAACAAARAAHDLDTHCDVE